MNKKILLASAILVILVVGVYYLNKKTNNSDGVACTMEAKICPDGSSVGRSGPNCEFAECPALVEKKVSARLNERVSVNGVYITPVKVISDSRCPIDVQCIQAGTVVLSVKLELNGQTRDDTISMGDTISFSGKLIQLFEVTPVTNSKITIKQSDYKFTFSVK